MPVQAHRAAKKGKDEEVTRRMTKANRKEEHQKRVQPRIYEYGEKLSVRTAKNSMARYWLTFVGHVSHLSAEP